MIFGSQHRAATLRRKVHGDNRPASVTLDGPGGFALGLEARTKYGIGLGYRPKPDIALIVHFSTAKAWSSPIFNPLAVSAKVSRTVGQSINERPVPLLRNRRIPSSGWALSMPHVREIHPINSGRRMDGHMDGPSTKSGMKHVAKMSSAKRNDVY